MLRVTLPEIGLYNYVLPVVSRIDLNINDKSKLFYYYLCLSKQEEEVSQLFLPGEWEVDWLSEGKENKIKNDNKGFIISYYPEVIIFYSDIILFIDNFQRRKRRKDKMFYLNIFYNALPFSEDMKVEIMNMYLKGDERENFWKGVERCRMSII